VVVGTPSFADSQEFTRRPLNGDLFLNAIGWLVGQSETISVRSRTVRASRAELTPAQARRIMFLSIFIIPEMLVLLGVSVWWWRRSR
jgi:ABC-2 type transport system permease protein